MAEEGIGTEKQDTNYEADDYDPEEKYSEQEEEFVKVKEMLERHDRLGHFSSDYVRLLDTWKETHKREVYFASQIKSMRTELTTCQTRIEADAFVLESQKNDVDRLKEELAGAWRMVDAVHAREQLTQETLVSLRAQVTKLSHELDLNKKMGTDPEQEAGILVKNKEMLLKEKERLMAEILVAKGRLSKAQRYQRELEDRNDEAENKLAQLTSDLETQKNDLTKEKRVREKVEKELQFVEDELKEKEKELQNQITLFHNQMKIVQKHEATIKEQKNIIDKLSRDVQETAATLKNTKSDLEQQQANVSRLHNDLGSKSQDLKLKEEECLRLRLEEQKLRKNKENALKKIALYEGKKTECEIEKGKLMATISAMDKEMNEVKKQLISDGKVIEALTRERELIARAAQKSTTTATELQNTIALQNVEKKRLEDEVHELQIQMAKLQKEVKEGQEEREQLNADLAHAKRKAEEAAEDMKLKLAQICQLKKESEDAEAKMRLHVTLFEQVRAERNKVSKNLVEATEEISELTHKLKVKSYEVEQLKEDISAKEGMLIKGEANLQKVTKEKESLRLDRQKVISELRESKERLLIFSQEEKRLLKIVEETDCDRARLTKELHQVNSDREVLTSQLIRRNEETNRLNEKLSNLEDVLRKSKVQYQQRVEDIRMLKIEIKTLRQEKAVLTRGVGNAIELKQEMFHLQREFNRERLKSRSLEEQLTNPLNVHRWRQLEGSDPPKFQLVQKVRLLQRRLIAATEESIQRDAQLAEAQKVLNELKSAMEKQPASELTKRLHETQVGLREKNTKIKALMGELAMYTNQVEEYKLDLEHRNKELTQMKNKYFLLKRREQKVKQRESDLEKDKSFLPLLESGSSGKFVGGGFNVLPPMKSTH